MYLLIRPFTYEKGKKKRDRERGGEGRGGEKAKAKMAQKSGSWQRFRGTDNKHIDDRVKRQSDSTSNSVAARRVISPALYYASLY
jgi:hypothetical protein